MRQNIPDLLADGRYEVGALIGHGGMAEVHLGTDTRLGRQIAIKIMRSDLASDAIFLSRFRREAHSVAMLNNPNIVSIYDTGEEPITSADGHTESVPYLVMEYVKGQTLRDILKENGALSQTDAEQIIVGVLNALEYSHRMGIIHRDIKPGNIMISDQGVVKVMDFGIARALDDSAATMTQSQGVVGTAQYLSPEQARGENVDMRSDLYSAGCVLYEVLTGRPPFTGDSPVAIAYQHVSEIATKPSSIVPGLPAVWDSVLAKAMAKDRQNRYATAAEFKRDVMAIMNGGVVAAAAFNPLTDLANLRARKEQETAATQAMPAANAGEATQAFAPLGAGTATALADGDTTPDGQSRSAKLAAEKKRKKKLAIIWSIVGVVVLALLAVGAWAIFGRGGPEMVTVPTITEDMSDSRAREKIEAVGFVYEQETDTNSTKPEGTFTKQDPAGGKKAEKGSTVRVWFSAGPSTASIPDVAGMTQDDARDTLEAQGFEVASTSSEDSADVEKDRVTRTDPAAGSSQPKGTSVILYISTGQTTVPDVAGRSSSEAQQMLTKAGFSITVQSRESDTVAKDAAIGTDPAAGSTVEQKSMVTLFISTGKEQVTIPSGLVGEDLSFVIGRLGSDVTVQVSPASAADDDGAEVTAISSDGKDLANGGTVDKGATITVTVEPTDSGDGEDVTDPTASK